MVATISSTAGTRLSGGGHTTAFERNVLPGFARWFVARVEEHQPDLLIPAETKGARLLEIVLDYARHVLGTPIDVPVLYGIALAYVEPGVLANARVLVIDDAVRTGQNLERHKRWVMKYGGKDVQAVACIGYLDDSATDLRADCYRLVGDVELYREYVWQLTELVVARRLPPEVDHHVFTLRLPSRLPIAWDALAAALTGYGTLSLDGPLGGESDIVSMTLHFPELPGALKHPTEGDVRIEGVNKIRFFPDAGTGEIYVVPVSFPALDLPLESNADHAHRLIRGWAQRSDSIGTVLLEEVKQCDAEMIFRALSTCTEVDLICGLARVLAKAFPEGGVTILTQRELFGRLYGERAGERIAERIDTEVALGLETHDAPLGDDHAAQEVASRLPLDGDVVTTTIEIAQGLKKLYDDRAVEPDHQPSDRVGLSLTQITEELGVTDPLLISRCFDFGLAMTTLVPYVEMKEAPGGVLSVRREYRVSEINRDPEQPYEDIDDIRRQVSEETIALIARYLRTCSKRYSGRPIPVRILAWLAAILRILVLEEHGILLEIEPGATEPVVVLCRREKPVTLFDASASMFVLRDGIVPTTGFEQRYGADDQLRLDVRKSAVEIESFLDPLIDLIDKQPNDQALDAVLACWAMSTDNRLGLSYPREDLSRALGHIERPLRVVMREEIHEPSVDMQERADAFADSARAKLDLLETDWATQIRGNWAEPLKRQRRLLGSLAAPTYRDPHFDLLRAIADLVPAVGLLTAALDSASAGWYANPEEDEAVRATAAQTIEHCANMRRALMSMSDDRVTPHEPSDVRDALRVASEALLRVSSTMRMFAAAAAGMYRGTPGRRTQQARDAARTSTVLSVDLSKSFEHARLHEFDADHEWKNSGLNLVAQWGKAFGGCELKDREGDAIWLEFASPEASAVDPAVLCAAAVQQHTRSLRSTNVASLWWGMRMAVDHGQLKDGDGGNVSGLDRAARLAKVLKDEPSIERVFVTPDAAKLCSAELGALMHAFEEEVQLDPVGGDGDRDAGARIIPQVVDIEPTMQRLCERVREVAREVKTAVTEPEQGEALRRGEPRDAPEEERSAEASA